ncbi:hypothetical protein BKX93_11360 [Chromobacterium vaccinii]|uniref:Chaperone protein DnaJ n=1 Tax=Chromobacterium vaccinii TaxID=1108595 RepID=A0A1D9LGY0_9NEIS|nr:hypothetical protein BKX93_11360 [Chromobacterium vaccinii]
MFIVDKLRSLFDAGGLILSVKSCLAFSIWGEVGMAKMVCPECKGEGEVPCILAFGSEKHPPYCPLCKGDDEARIPCEMCEGIGEIDM